MFPSSIRHCSPAASKGDISIESAWGHFHRVATCRGRPIDRMAEMPYLPAHQADV
jgi:hypothetical protein